MKRFAAVSAVFLSILLISLLAAGCCCPVGIPGFDTLKSNAEKAADDAAKRQSEADNTVTENGAPANGALGAGEVDLVKNGDFSNGLSGWTTRTQPGSKVAGDNSVALKGSGAKYVELKRENGGNDGGGAYASQDINKDVTGYTSIVVKVAANVIAENGGNIANTNQQFFPEGACQVRVFYTAADGSAKEWYHGFYSETVAGADADHFTQVDSSTWTSWASPNLMASVPAPRLIKKIEVYGFGWGFYGNMTAIQIIAK